jgi:hypothetical protein
LELVPVPCAALRVVALRWACPVVGRGFVGGCVALGESRSDARAGRVVALRDAPCGCVLPSGALPQTPPI